MATTNTEPVDLDHVSAALLDRARRSDARRAAQTLTPGPGAAMTQTVLAVCAGQALNEHENPGMATLQLLQGRVRLLADGDAVEIAAGQWVPIPPTRHAVEVAEDAVMLLTVAAAGGGEPR